MKIYAVKISDMGEEKLYKLCLMVGSEKKYKIEKFINKKDKIRSLIGEVLIRTIIAEELDITNKCLKFERNQYGKLYLKDHPQFNFNISHSEEYVVCAIDNKPIGIDVEMIKHIEYKEIAKSFFTTGEFGYIVNQDLNFQLNKFYEIWTLKESYIKCCGQGLSIPLKSFSIQVDQNENIKVISNNKCKEYKFKILDIEPGYKLAVCSLNKEISSNITIVDQNSLINQYFRFNMQ
ncbi:MULTISPECIES: 4'-phosphopantetheinyl transferase family protein [unclassified Clostridium]|uniref:4'-phosphopantetheinyl transferase family protein n=1 Tax=unclassified Clostridium TaxID=2614128 RepID=UPI0025BE66F4|nr:MULTISPECIES: 4'-phosphopantetheinyl transferase superfamily protein [unclassified Clostridium]